MRLLLLISFIFLLLAPATAAEPLRIDALRFGQSGDNARIVFELNKKVSDYKAFLLENPSRLVLEMPAAELAVSTSRFVSNNIVKSYHMGVLDDGIRRVIFDLKRTAIIDGVFTIPKDGTNRDRLVIDMKPSSKNMFKAKTEEITGNKNLKGDHTLKAPTGRSFKAEQNDIVRAVAPVVVPVKRPARQYTIVIDPGHGGDDPGAVGATVKEKHITLAVSKEVKRQLEETGRYKVVLTREQDNYIKLHDRVDMARHVGGDLFISIHADKIDRTNIRGASIYTLSEKASDAESARLAEEENNAGFVAGVDLSQESKDVSDILLDLAMREKMNESNMFARMLTYALQKHGVKLLPNSHRSAGFAVLKAPDIPSILIETGFLSNPDEAKLLSSSQFQSNLAGAVVDGVDDYFRKIKALQKL